MVNPDAIPLSSEPIDPNRIDRFPTGLAWPISVVSWTCGAVVFAILIRLAYPNQDLTSAVSEFWLWLERVTSDLSWWQFLLAAAAWLMAVEGMLLFFAFLMTGWSAGMAERLVVTWRRSVVAVWLFVPFVVVFGLLVTAVAVSLVRRDMQYNRAFVYEPPPDPPDSIARLPFGAMSYSGPPVQPTPEQQAEIEAHQAAVRAHWHIEASRSSAYLDEKPWPLKHHTAIGAWLASATGVGLLIGFLAWAAPRERRRLCLLPPLCDECGYNLHGLTTGKVCPECGYGIPDSLGHEVRDGLGLELPSSIVRALSRAFFVWRHPADFGKRLQLGAPIVGLRRQATVMAVVIYLACGPPLALWFERLNAVMVPGEMYRPEGATYYAVFVFGPIVGAILAVVEVLFCAAWGGGYDFQYRAKLMRIQTRATMQAAIAWLPLSPFLIWLIALATAAAWAGSEAWLRDTVWALRFPGIDIAWMLVPVVGVFALAMDRMRIGLRVAKAARYATQ
ncbi:MAG: hypothetical protein AAGB29_04190 [Planctomycetota bacterium]